MAGTPPSGGRSGRATDFVAPSQILSAYLGAFFGVGRVSDRINVAESVEPACAGARRWRYPGRSDRLRGSPARGTAMHYPRRQSNVKRRRKFGFRARMKTTLGRKMINRKRRMGRRLSAIG